MISKTICTPNPRIHWQICWQEVKSGRGLVAPLRYSGDLESPNVLGFFRGDRLKTLLWSIMSHWHIITKTTRNKPYMFTLIIKRIWNLWNIFTFRKWFVFLSIAQIKKDNTDWIKLLFKKRHNFVFFCACFIYM